jgi:two-component system, sporulation sensor kinase E
MHRVIRISMVALMIVLVTVMFYFIIFNSHTADKNTIALHNWEYRLGAAPNRSSAFSNWLQEANGTQAWHYISEPSNPTDRGNQNEMWLRTTLPSKELRDPSLYLQVFEHYELYSKEKLIYSYGSFDPKKRLNYPGTPIRIVVIPDEALGQPLYLHVFSQSKDIGIINEPRLGTKADFILSMLHSSAERFSFGFLYMVSGLIFLIIAANLPRQWIFVSFSIFLLFYGLYSICMTPLIYLFYDSPLFWTYIELISLYIWVGGMLAFVEQMFGPGYKKIIRRLWQLTAAYALFSLMGIAFNVLTFPQSVIVFQAIILGCVLVVLSHIYHKAWMGNHEAGIFSIGLLLVSGSGLFDIVKYLFMMTKEMQSVTHLSILIFIGILIYIMVKRLLKMIASIKQAEKMAVVGQMAASVAHEIRNPMTVISGFLQLMRKDIQNPSHMEAIMSEIVRINDLITNFLLFSNPTQLKYVEYSLQSILEDTVDLFQPLLVDGVTTIEMGLDAEIPPIQCDPNKIKQVLINLIKNAIESMDSGGIVQISLLRNPDQAVEIHISDQGSGIAPEHLKRIWEPFFTTKQSGTGLGLMVSMKIVELHQGKIKVYSKRHEGTTFIIEMPLTNEMPA